MSTFEFIVSRFFIFPAIIRIIFYFGCVCLLITFASYFIFKPKPQIPTLQTPPSPKVENKSSIPRKGGAGFRATGNAKMNIYNSKAYNNEEGIVAEDNAQVNVIDTTSEKNKTK